MCKACEENNETISKSTVDKMTDDIYKLIERNETVVNIKIETQNRENSQVSARQEAKRELTPKRTPIKNESRETRQTNNPLLRDLIKILILLFPFALLSLVTTSTSWIFKSWFRTFFSLIFVQIFIIFVLILLFSLNINTSDIFSQISYISTIFILTKSNSYIKELLGGISTDLNYNILNFKNLFK